MATNERHLATRFFCNGDQFYPGLMVMVSRKRYPTLDRLIGDLSRLLAGPVNLPYGVRQIFRAEDGRRVDSVEDIVCDVRRRFVCAGFETFRPLQYGQRDAERWCVGNVVTNSSIPRVVVLQKTSRSSASIEAEDAPSSLAQSVDNGLDTSTRTPRRSNPKPEKLHRPKKINGVDPGETVNFGETVTPWETVTPGETVILGETVTSGRQPKSGKNRVKSAMFKAENLEDSHHSTWRKVNYKETTGTEWLQGLRRTPEVFKRSAKALTSSCGNLRNSGGTRKTPDFTSTWTNPAEIRKGSRETARSLKVPVVKSKTLENVEHPRDVPSNSPTTDIPKSSEETREVPVDCQTTPTGSRSNPISSCVTPVGFEEIPVSSLGTPVTNRKTREPLGNSTVTVAVSFNSIEKSGVSTRNTIGSLPSPFPLDHHSAFPLSPEQTETQSNIENDSEKIHPTKTSRNSIAKPPEPSQRTSKDIESADTDQLSSRQKGSKSRNRETPLKSNRSGYRPIVESGFPAKRFEMGEVLGEGNFAVVKRCKARATQVEYAMKVISKSKMKGKDEVVENELRILRSCRHANIVRLIESYETMTEFYVVMELVEGGDLFEAIRCRQRFPETEASSMVKDMARALQYLHQRKIVHRDVKPENFLVQRESDGSVKRLKLADFGLAVVTTGLLYKLCGTPTYVAPEILSDIGYGLEVDMWSVGVILYVLLSGYPPFRSSRLNDSELFDLIQLGQFVFDSPRWDHISDGARDLIHRLLEIKVRKRLRAEEVLLHPWIRSGAKESSPVSKDHSRSITPQKSLPPPVVIDSDPQSLPNSKRTVNLNMGGHHPHR